MKISSGYQEWFFLGCWRVRPVFDSLCKKKFHGVQRMVLECFRGILRVVQEYLKGDSNIIHGPVKQVSRRFQEGKRMFLGFVLEV